MIIGQVNKVSIEKAKSKVQFKKYYSVKIIEVEVLQVLNGKLKKQKIKLTTGTGIAACGFPFEEGKDYLITLAKAKNSSFKTGVKYSTNICLPNRLMNDLSLKERAVIEAAKLKKSEK